MSSLVIFDTSILVEEIRAGGHAERIESLNAIVRMSSVVLAELWRGYRSQVDRDWLMDVEENYKPLTPTTANWLESGRVLAHLRAERRFDASKLRDLHFDVLIALTARSHGARVITSNRADFELIRKYKPFELEIWPSV